MAYSDEILADSPVLYLRMNEPSGQPQDSSGNANHTTTTSGTPVYGVAGLIPSDPDDDSIDLEGGTRFTVPDHATLDVGDVFTLECWINRDSLAGASAVHTLLEKGSGGFQFAILGTGLGADHSFGLFRQDTAIIVTSTQALSSTTEDYYLAATKNGGTVKLWLGKLSDESLADVTGTVTDSTVPNNANAINVAAAYTGGQNYLGKLDEVAIYPTALSQARIQAHFDAALVATAEKQTAFHFRRRTVMR